MMTYRLARRARRDALRIWQHIAEDDERAADRFIDRLTHYFELLGDNPRAGRRRDELRPGYRSFPVGEYLIFYRIADPGVCIMHVMHGDATSKLCSAIKGLRPRSDEGRLLIKAQVTRTCVIQGRVFP